MIAENIRLLRKTKGLSQTEFAKRIYVSRDVISNIELQRVEPTDLIISAICNEFDINEEWLRTGNGEMFKPISVEDTIIDAFGKLMSQDDNSFAKQFVSALAQLGPDEWAMIEKFARSVVDGSKKSEKKEEE